MTTFNILFLADTTHPATAVSDHIKAITSNKKNHWHIINPLLCKTIDKLDLTLFDAIGIHYSIKPYNHYYLSAALKRKIAAYSGVKFLFLQDEYQRVNQVQDYLQELGFHLLFTLVEQSTIPRAYPDARLAGLKKVTVLTGYVSEAMKNYPTCPIGERNIDVSYRARCCDYWLGRLAYEKQYIATEFIKRSGNNLRLDISLEESDRLYGDNWLRLLLNSRAVLGTESGTSIWDFDNQIKKRVANYLKNNRHAAFEQVYEQVLKPDDGKIMYNAISPRVFEAAATKTPMIMFPGYYSGVCKPDVHYIVLEKDFSNFGEVVERLKDNQFLQTLADRTFADLITSERYSEAVFSEIITVEITQLIKKNASHSPELIAKALDNLQDKHNYLNLARKFNTELCFIMGNFFNLLLDPGYSWRERSNKLLQGCKRYLTYVVARVKKA